MFLFTMFLEFATTIECTALVKIREPSNEVKAIHCFCVTLKEARGGRVVDLNGFDQMLWKYWKNDKKKISGIYLFILFHLRFFCCPALICALFWSFFLLFCRFEHIKTTEKERILSNLWCESHPHTPPRKRLQTKQNWVWKPGTTITKEWDEWNETTSLSFRQVFAADSEKRNTKVVMSITEYREPRAVSPQFSNTKYTNIQKENKFEDEKKKKIRNK